MSPKATAVNRFTDLINPHTRKPILRMNNTLLYNILERKETPTNKHKKMYMLEMMG